MISYVDLFRPQPQDGVQQILSGGTNVLVGALNNAVQIGRDQANLRATQEREYLAERERVENLNQRRTEFAVQQSNVDRSFWDSVFRDERDTAEANKDDTRNFAFKARTDSRDATMRQNELDSVVGARTATTELAEKKFSLEKEELDEKKNFLKTRAADILTTAKPPSFIQKLFGADSPAPEDSLSLGKELKEIGVTLRDPTVMKRGDDLLSQGKKGVIERRERIRNTPLPSRAKTESDEERLVKLDRFVKAQERLRAELKAVDEEDEEDDLPDGTVEKLYDAQTEIEELRKKLAGKPGYTPPAAEPESWKDRVTKQYAK